MYLDHAATTPLRPEAAAAMQTAHETLGGNASGTHTVARNAKNALEQAREQIAAAIGADRPDEVIFTGGGTEADNLAIVGAALATDSTGVVVSAIEHKAVLEPAESLRRFGKQVSVVPPTQSGVVDPATVASHVSSDTGVVSIMTANNETGISQPVEVIALSVAEAAPDAVVHTDAVQAIVGADVSVSTLGIDLMTIAAHKFGGPKGVGALYARSGTSLEALIRGGGHEAGRRSGTSNVAGVVGMAAALESLGRERDSFASMVGTERQHFETALEEQCGAEITGIDVERLTQFAHMRIPGVNAESLLIRLDREGVYAAAGSSCQSGAIEPSHVLTAMRMTPDKAKECVRFTFGWTTAGGDGMRAADAVTSVVEQMR
ncbi:MAG: cysteine desulfurase family protein [Acidimicrobiia bacterium]